MDKIPTKKEELENLRNKRAKELGYLCYNMAADGRISNNELRAYISSVKNCFERFRLSTGSQKQYYAFQLDKEAENLGYVYYNLFFIDKKPISGSAEALCRSISEISDEITGKKPTAQTAPHNVTAASGGNKSIFIGDIPFEDKKGSDINKNLSSGFEEPLTGDFDETFIDKTEKVHGFKMNCPYGMEPIPVNAKKCRCGYRNRSYAKYCGKCGAKL